MSSFKTFFFPWIYVGSIDKWNFILILNDLSKAKENAELKLLAFMF